MHEGHGAKFRDIGTSVTEVVSNKLDNSGSKLESDRNSSENVPRYDTSDQCSRSRSFLSSVRCGILHLDHDEEFKLDGEEHDSIQGIRVDLHKKEDIAFHDLQNSMNLFMSRVETEFVEDENLSWDHLVKAVFFGGNFDGEQPSWLLEMYKNIENNAARGNLGRFGFRSSSDINPEDFIVFLYHYLQMALSGKSIQTYYGPVLKRTAEEDPELGTPAAMLLAEKFLQSFYQALSEDFPMLKFEGYLAGLKCLSSTTDTDDSPPPACVRAQQTFTACQTARFFAPNSCYSFDGSKSVCSNSTSLSGLSKDPNAVYVDHQLSHTPTGMCLGVTRQEREQPIMGSLNAIFNALSRNTVARNSSEAHVVDNENFLQGCTFFLHPSYSKPEVVQSVLDHGGDVHGTVKRTSGKYSTLTMEPGKLQYRVEHDPLYALWATSGGQKPMYHLEYRDDLSEAIARFVTSSRAYGPERWVYNISPGPAARGVDAPSREPDFHRNVRQLTSPSGGREWYLAHLYRLTPTTSTAILRLAAKDVEKQCSECTEEVSLVLQALRTELDLNFVAHEPMVPAQDIKSEKSLVDSGTDSAVQGKEVNEASLRLEKERDVPQQQQNPHQTSNEGRNESSVATESTSYTPPSKRRRVSATEPVSRQRLIEPCSLLQPACTTPSPITSFFESYAHRDRDDALDVSFTMRKEALNEKAIYDTFSAFLEEKGNINVLWKDTVGVVAHKTSPILATSVDAVCLLYLPDDRVCRAAVAIKSSTSPKELARLEKMPECVKEFSCLSEEFLEVPSENRHQLLHHAAVYDLQRTLFIEGMMGTTHHAFIVSFPAAVRDAYRKVLMKTQMRYLWWLYGPLQAVPLEHPVRGLTFGEQGIPGRDCIMLHMEIFRYVERACSSEVLPHCSGFLPAAVSAWNKATDGVDLFDRYAGSFNFQTTVDDHQMMFLTCVEKACINLYLLHAWYLVGAQANSMEHFRHLKRQNMINFKDTMMSNCKLIRFLLTRHIGQIFLGRKDLPTSMGMGAGSIQQLAGISVDYLTEEDYSVHELDWLLKTPNEINLIRRHAMKRFNIEGSIAWKVRHSTSLDHVGVRYIDFVETRISDGTLPREDYRTSTSELNLPRNCAYCRAAGWRSRQFKRTEAISISRLIDHLGRSTRMYCSGCHVFLCTHPYGARIYDDGRMEPLPSCFELWHTCGKLVRPDDGYSGVKSWGTTEAKPEGYSVQFDKVVRKAIKNSGSAVNALSLSNGYLTGGSSFRKEFRPVKAIGRRGQLLKSDPSTGNPPTESTDETS